MAFSTGVEAVVHGALALGSALMSFAVFDFKTPRLASWVGAVSTGALAAVFLLQGVSEVTHNEALTYGAYQWWANGWRGGWSTCSWLGVLSSWWLIGRSRGGFSASSP